MAARTKLGTFGATVRRWGWTGKGLLSLVTGGNDSLVVLLLHCDGDAGSVVFTDVGLGGTPKTCTPVNGAMVGAQHKFGDGSLWCDGGGAYLAVEAHPDFAFGTGDFTVEAWAKITLDSCHPYLFAWYANEDNFFALENVVTRGDAAIWQLRLRTGGIDRCVATGAGYVQSVGDWHHFAVCRASGTIRMFVDGVEHASVAYEENVDPSGWPLSLGRSRRVTDTATRSLDGYMDEVRVTRDARYPAAFTPYQNEFTSRFVQSITGAWVTKGTFEQVATGNFGILYHRYQQLLTGEHLVRAALRQSMTGQHATLTTFVQAATGIVGIGVPAAGRFIQGASGQHVVLAAFVQTVTGQHGAQSRYVQSASGAHGAVMRATQSISGQFTIARAFLQSLTGTHRIKTTSRYELYYGFNAEPNFGAAPWQTFTALPFTTPALAAGLHKFVLRYRNQWGLLTENVQAQEFETDGSGALLLPRPTLPMAQVLVPGPDQSIQFQAWYAYGQDGQYAADQFLVYHIIGFGDPDPLVDVPEVVPMIKADGVAKLVWTSPPLGAGVLVSGFVMTRRTGAGGRDSVQPATMLNATEGSAPVAVGSAGLFHDAAGVSI